MCWGRIDFSFVYASPRTRHPPCGPSARVGELTKPRRFHALGSFYRFCDDGYAPVRAAWLNTEQNELPCSHSTIMSDTIMDGTIMDGTIVNGKAMGGVRGRHVPAATAPSW